MSTVLYYLRNYATFKEQAYAATNINLVDTLLDIELLIKKLNLTKKQIQVLNLYFIKGMTQEDIALALGVTQQAVNGHIRAIKDHIKDKLDEWDNLYD